MFFLKYRIQKISYKIIYLYSSEGKGSYATLGHQLGTSIRELHRCLSLALLSEKFPGALVRTLKTIELLVENVNYSKLKPGMLTKIVTHVKYFMRYKGKHNFGEIFLVL